MVTKIEKLAYDYTAGSDDLPTLVFLPGFRSDMKGAKAQHLKERAIARGQSCLLLDYSGHGQSGGHFEDGTIGLWTEDALRIIDHVLRGKRIIVIGSSMGGWIGLHVALRRKQMVAGYIGIAAAPDFTREIDGRMNDAQRDKINKDGYFAVPSEYGDDLIITRKLIEDGEGQCLLDHDIDITVPVVLLQGKRDADVPWEKANRIKSRLKSTDVEIVFIEDGDHRLSRAEDLVLLDRAVLKLSGGVF